MAVWRFGRGWDEATLRRYLAELEALPVSFDTPYWQMTPEHGWTVDGIEATLGSEPPGPPLTDGLFARARQGLVRYDFSDPRIVEGHFDPNAPLRGRNMLLELKVLGFRFLAGVRVTDVREESDGTESVFGYRYATLAGHIERGYEWFLLTKLRATGQVRFAIEAHWRPGDFPNLWSRIGFRLLGEHYRRRWRREAPERLKRLALRPARPAAPGELAQRGEPLPLLPEAPAPSRERE